MIFPIDCEIEIFEDYKFKKPYIIFTFDDGMKSTIDNGIPIFDFYNKKCTLYIVSNFVNIGAYSGMPCTDWLTLKNLQNQGYDIQGHTHSHPHLDQKSNEQIINEITIMQSYFIANGLKAAEHLAYPHGDYNDNVIDIISKYLLTARTFVPDGIVYDKNINEYELSSIRIDIKKDDNVQLEYIKSIIDLAYDNNYVLIMATHSVLKDSEMTTEKYAIQTSYLEFLIDYIENKNIDIITISELYDKLI